MLSRQTGHVMRHPTARAVGGDGFLCTNELFLQIGFCSFTPNLFRLRRRVLRSTKRVRGGRNGWGVVGCRRLRSILRLLPILFLRLAVMLCWEREGRGGEIFLLHWLSMTLLDRCCGAAVLGI